MKKLLGSIKKPKSRSDEGSSNGYRNTPVVPTGDGPEAVIYREVGAFCESSAPNSQSAGEEYLHLPAIVDAAESSPSAANQAAVRIRGYLGKDHYDRGFAQYNAIMLTRILTDNPGRIFTQNFDKEFISTVKKLLREGRDGSVQQILRETLDYFEIKASENDTLMPLTEMWRKEKGAGARITYPRAGQMGRGPPAMPPRPRGLPPPDELAGRIEEARTTARLLVQTIQSTPLNEVLQNDLMKEFAERARVAQKSIQGYMNCENPHPDDETMLTLIETSEQLNVAMTKHQRAVLQARKAMGGATPSPQPQDPSRNQYMMGVENVYNQQPPSQMQRPPQTQPQRQDQPPILSPPVVNGQGRHSPQNNNFLAPSGPPPGRPANNVYSDYQTQPSKYTAPTATANYEVASNPFTDTAGYDQKFEPDQQHQQNYTLFDRNPSPQPPNQSNTYGHQREQANTYGQQKEQTDAYAQSTNESTYSQPQHSQPQYSPQQRPGAYSQGFVSTPSYMHRQDSAAEHITMHGASPPPSSNQR